MQLQYHRHTLSCPPVLFGPLSPTITTMFRPVLPTADTPTHKRGREESFKEETARRQQVMPDSCSNATMPSGTAHRQHVEPCRSQSRLCGCRSANPVKQQHSGQHLCGCYESIGGRDYMEDRHICAEVSLASAQTAPLLVAGVFDGHGGSAVAEYLANHTVDTLERQLYSAQPAHGQAAQAEALQHAFHALDAALGEEHARRAPLSLQDDMGGSTAVVVVCSQDSIICANCGDSRAVLARSGQPALPLSDDHRPDRPDEQARIQQAGGHVMHYCGGPRVMGVLAMSRAFGDTWLQKYGVTAQPEMKIVERDASDEFLVVASDGLWATLTNEEAVDLARRCLQRAVRKGANRASAVRITAKVLAHAAIQRGSRDNITVVIVDLQQQQQQRAEIPGVQVDVAAEQSLSTIAGTDSAPGPLPAPGSLNSPSQAAPATPRIPPPPLASILTPRSKSWTTASCAEWQSAQAPSNLGSANPLLNGDIFCSVRVQSSRRPYSGDGKVQTSKRQPPTTQTPPTSDAAVSSVPPVPRLVSAERIVCVVPAAHDAVAHARS